MIRRAIARGDSRAVQSYTISPSGCCRVSRRVGLEELGVVKSPLDWKVSGTAKLTALYIPVPWLEPNV
jgi:hypothetical protein